MTQAAYLDHNATTPVRPSAAEAMAAAVAMTGNASSVHGFGRAARRTVEDARRQVAALIGAAPADVVFTSGGTEANALAIRGSRCARVIVSAVEHAAVLRAVDDPQLIAVDRDGIVGLDALEELLSAPGCSSPRRSTLVSVMLANNETGVIQPVAHVAEIAHRHGAVVHCDAVQAAGKLPIDVTDLGVDLLSVSAHKLGGPAGAGALVIRGGAHISAVLLGGGQERGLRGGTENLPGIAGFGAAAAECLDDRDTLRRVLALRDGLEAEVRRRVPQACVIAADAPRLPNTSCVAMAGIDSEIQVMALDLAGVAVSAGAACSSGKVSRSHVMAAMRVPEPLARSAIRVSLGWTSNEEDVERFLDAWSAFGLRAGRVPEGGRNKAA